MSDQYELFMTMLRNVLLFADHGNFLKLRQYQVEVANAVVDSVVNQRGLTFVVIFPRQSGKNELQAQLESYLLAIFSSTGCRDGQGFADLEAAEPERHAPPGAGAQTQPGCPDEVDQGAGLYLSYRLGSNFLLVRVPDGQHRRGDGEPSAGM